MTGQRLWLSEHGDPFRLNVATVGPASLGSYQSHLEILAATLRKCREAAGPDWYPQEISFAYKAQENLPEIELFAESRILRGTGETYVTLPRSMMALRFLSSGSITQTAVQSPLARPLPSNLTHLVQLHVGCLLNDRPFDIDAIAETLGMSRRTLQRSLAYEGTSYSQVLTDARIHIAADWLEHTDQPIAEIAFDLGYTDSSNFTRAFRRWLGVSPQAFREEAKAI